MMRTLNFSLVTVAILFGSTALGAKHVVQVQNGRFSPSPITISVGDTIEFQNTSAGTHTVTADPALAAIPSNIELPVGAEPFNSGRLTPGKTFSHTFAVAGNYRYVCLPHEKMGMKGAVFVTEATADGEDDVVTE